MSPKRSSAAGGAVESSPTIGPDGTVFAGPNDTRGCAIAPPTGGTVGTAKWVYRTGAAIESSPALGSDGTQYIRGFDHNSYAFANA